MASGYVYILTNQSMPGLIKIGRTFRDSRERARELQTTGVPTPFELAFETFSLEFEKLENEIHCQLESFKVSTNREFFRFPLNKAIELLNQLNSSLTSNVHQYRAESILDQMVKKYPSWLRTNIVDIRIVQTPGRVWLEVTEEEERAGYLVDQTIRRSDLAFISDKAFDDRMFLPNDNVNLNAYKFVNELDPYSLIHTTDIFHDAAFEEINKTLNPHKIDES